MPSSKTLRIFRAGQADAAYEYAVPLNAAIEVFGVTAKDQEGDEFESALEIHILTEDDPKPPKFVDPEHEDESPTRKSLGVIGDDPRPKKKK